MLHVVKYPFEPLDDKKTQKNSRENFKTQQKNSKLKGKTQFSGISEANKVSQSALKKACITNKFEK